MTLGIIQGYLIGEFDYSPALGEGPHGVLLFQPARLINTKTQLNFHLLCMIKPLSYST